MQDDCITIALGMPEVRVVREEEMAEAIMVEVAYRAEQVSCPRCGQETPKVHSVRRQRKRDRRLRDKAVFLVLHKRRFRCVWCKKVFSEPDPLFGARRRSSRRFREYLGQEALHQTVRHVAQREGVGEGLVRRSLTEEAQRLFGVPEQPRPARILGIDEFSIRKGQVYDTAIMDLEDKRVLGVVSGHGQQEVQGFLERLPEAEEALVMVMDMHEPYRQAVEMSLPKAAIVVDKFHVLRHVHWALDQVRISLQPTRGKRGELFRARYLLLTGAERLTPEQASRLREVLERYPQLRKAWALKEAFRAWYATPSRAEADRGLAVWQETVRREGLAPFLALFSMLRTWRREILNYFDHRYTNGFVEGKNNRIKVIKRTAYGYRNRHNFRTRILLTNLSEATPKAA